MLCSQFIFSFNSVCIKPSSSNPVNRILHKYLASYVRIQSSILNQPCRIYDPRDNRAYTSLPRWRWSDLKHIVEVEDLSTLYPATSSGNSLRRLMQLLMSWQRSWHQRLSWNKHPPPPCIKPPSKPFEAKVIKANCQHPKRMRHALS